MNASAGRSEAISVSCREINTCGAAYSWNQENTSHRTVLVNIAI